MFLQNFNKRWLFDTATVLLLNLILSNGCCLFTITNKFKQHLLLLYWEKRLVELSFSRRQFFV
jgi:hypothetical protein